MNGPLPHADGFKQRIRELFHKHSTDCRLVRVARNDSVYVSGQQDPTVYYVHVGQIKLLLPSPEYREYLLTIHTPGDIFGELCLAGRHDRLETAVAMEDSCLKQIPARTFLACVRSESLLEGLVQFLAVRIAEQQEVITSLATLNSEHRLAWVLIQLARDLGQPHPLGTRVSKKISQEELGEMVGTTRTRVGVFLKRFRDQGWIRQSPEHCLVIDSSRLEYFLDHRYTDQKELQRALRKVETAPNNGVSNATGTHGTDLDRGGASVPREGPAQVKESHRHADRFTTIAG